MYLYSILKPAPGSRSVGTIGGLRGGAEPGAAAPLFQIILYDSTPFNRPGNRFIKCSLILSSET